MRRQQLMLTVDNMHLPVLSKLTMYDDILSVWTTALTIVEKLTDGTGQSIQSGEALLGLWAWHIYPGICAVGEEPTLVAQNDVLVRMGGRTLAKGMGTVSPGQYHWHTCAITEKLPWLTPRLNLSASKWTLSASYTLPCAA